jgi:hypothetical protein
LREGGRLDLAAYIDFMSEVLHDPEVDMKRGKHLTEQFEIVQILFEGIQSF